MNRTVNRRTKIRRRLRAEPLEDRRLLATLDLVPAAGAGTISEEDGRTVVTVMPGTMVNVTAQVATAETAVQGFQLNLSDSNSQLAIDNFALGTDFPVAVDQTLDSSVNDYFVASALIGQLSVPPPRLFGSFDVTAPTAAGDYLVTSNFTTGSELTNTILSDATGAALPITDFGDLIVRVAAVDAPAATLDLVPAAGAGTISEEDGRTVVTVTPGTTVNVTAQVATAETAVQGFQLNLLGSNSQLAIDNFALGTDFPVAVDQTLDSSVNDYFVASALIGQLSVPPPRLFGSFDVTAPTAAGDYLVTSNFTTGSELTNTILSDATGAALSITDFGDLIVRVAAAEPTVTVAVSPGSVLEDGTANLVYTFTRSGDNTAALTANFSVGGTATLTTDYAATGADSFTASTGTVTFAAGSSTGTVTVDPVADTAVEPDETVLLTVTAGTGYTIGTADLATGTITNDDVALPEVTVAVSPGSVLEDGTANLVYTFTRSGDSTAALTANFSVGGTATLTTDYAATGADSFTASTGTVTFAAGSSTGTVTVDPVADTAVEPDETVLLTVTAGTGYTIGTADLATGTITNDDVALPEVTVAVSPGSVLEDGTANLVYTFTRSGDNTAALTANFSVGGTATLTTDYAATGADSFTASTGTVTFAAGSSTGTVTVDPVADTAVEPDETVLLTVTAGTGYTIGTADLATGTITNDDVALPEVTVAVSPGSVLEDGTANLVYTFTRSGDNTAALTANFSVGGTATLTTDYAATGADSFTASTGTVTFAAGSSTGTVTVDPVADTAVEPDETVLLTVTAGTGYTVGTADLATGTITNDDVALPEVTVAVSPTSVLEDGTANLVYTFTRSGDNTAALTANFSVGGTATLTTDYAATGADSFTASTGTVSFAAGSSTGTVTVDPVADTAVEPDETVLLTVTAGTGYTVGTADLATGTITNDDVSAPANASLSGFVRDPNGRGIPGVFIELTGSPLGETVLRALTADDGSYGFINLAAGNYTITENQPPAFVDGGESIGSQGGVTSDDMFEITALLANDEGRNNNFAESRLVPGQISKRYFLASTNIAQLYRNANANLTELAGNPEDADLIRTSGIPSVVSAELEPNNLQVSQAPTIVPIPDQQATVGQRLRVAVVATDPNNDLLQFTLDPDNSPVTAEIVPANDGAEIRWTPTAQDVGQPVLFRVIATDPGQSSDTEDFMVSVTETVATVNQAAAAAEAEQITPQPTTVSLPTAEEKTDGDSQDSSLDQTLSESDLN